MAQDSGLIVTEMTGQRICVSHGSMTPPAEFFAHTIPQSVCLNTCEQCSGIASSGAASVHIRPAYQICGAKQQICEGGSCRQWLMHICTSGLGGHTCPALAMVGLDPKSCILTLAL